MLAFVAMLAWEGFNKAEAVTDAEASLVENVYLLVEGLSGPEMAGMREDIVAYASSVLSREWPAQAAGRPVMENEPHLSRPDRDDAAPAPPRRSRTPTSIRSCSTIWASSSTARRERLFAARTPIPTILWAVLVAGGALTVAFASFLGSPSVGMHLAMSSLLALSGALILLAIVAPEQPVPG